MAAYDGLLLPFLRLGPFRSSNGLSTAAIIPVATLDEALAALERLGGDPLPE